jgi:aspartate carbamoyltransferase regulatory subunit
MKKLKIEIKMYIAEVLLNWAFTIAPVSEEDGRKLKTSIIEYFESCVRCQINANVRTTHENGKCLHNVGSQDSDGYFRCLYCGSVVEDLENYR